MKTTLKILLGSLLLLGTPALITRCSSTTSTSKTTSVLIPFDLSGSHEKQLPSSEAIAEYILEASGHKSGAYFRDRIVVRLSYLGNTTRPQIKMIVLEEAPPLLYYNRKKRDREIKSFVNHITQELDTLLASGSDQQSSYIHHGLAHQLEVIQSDPADKKLVLLFSDGLEDSPFAKFVDYAEESDLFRSEIYSISAKLNRQKELVDLSGVEIQMFNCPDPNTDPLLIEMSDEFWKYHLKAKGADFKVKSTMN